MRVEKECEKRERRKRESGERERVEKECEYRKRE